MPAFFGLTRSWRENFLEESFNLQMHLGMDYNTVYKLPVNYRKWYIDRLIKHLKDKNEAYKESRKNNKKSSGFQEEEKLESSNFDMNSFKKFESLINSKK